MNNKYLFILLIVIIIISTALFFPSDESVDKTDKPVSKPNVISHTEKKTLPSGFDQEKWQKKHDEKMALLEQSWLSFLAGREVEPMNRKPTYLEAYRDYVYYDGCISIISNVLNGIEPFKYSLTRNQNYEDLPLAQQKALDERLSKCLQLSDFGQRSYDAGFAQQSLKQRYEAITPKTDKEQQLAATLKLLKDLNYNINRLSSEQRGENIDPQLYVDLFTMRRELENQIPKPATIFGGYNETDQLIVDQLRRQIAEIDQQILDNKHIDTEEVTGFKAEIKRLISQLQKVVIDTRSSDAYLAVYEFIKEGRLEADIEAVEAQFTGGIQLIPKQYESYLMPILVHFRACELSHPCGPDSLLVEEQCLNFRNEKAPMACQAGLIDFYLNYYLSPNQLLDVEYILTEGY